MNKNIFKYYIMIAFSMIVIGLNVLSIQAKKEKRVSSRVIVDGSAFYGEQVSDIMVVENGVETSILGESPLLVLGFRDMSVFRLKSVITDTLPSVENVDIKLILMDNKTGPDQTGMCCLEKITLNDRSQEIFNRLLHDTDCFTLLIENSCIHYFQSNVEAADLKSLLARYL